MWGDTYATTGMLYWRWKLRVLPGTARRSRTADWTVECGWRSRRCHRSYDDSSSSSNINNNKYSRLVWYKRQQSSVIWLSTRHEPQRLCDLLYRRREQECGEPLDGKQHLQGVCLFVFGMHTSSKTYSCNLPMQIYQYDPTSDSTFALHSRTPRLLQRRLLALHKMYQTTTIGILVHNVGLRSSHAIVKDLRKLIRSKGRKSYTISVGRVRPEKLANFEAVGGWVLVGCREGGLIEGKEFYRPIVTPHELRLTLQGEMETWKPEEWTLDLDSVLRDVRRDQAAEDAAHHQRALDTANGDTHGDDDDDADGNQDDDDRPIFSLADGSYHMTRRYGLKTDEPLTTVMDPTTGALVARSHNGTLVKQSEESRVAAIHLQGRTFRGLDANEGYDAHGVLAPSDLVDGRVGVARGYRVDKLGKEGQE